MHLLEDFTAESALFREMTLFRAENVRQGKTDLR